MATSTGLHSDQYSKCLKRMCVVLNFHMMDATDHGWQITLWLADQSKTFYINTHTHARMHMCTHIHTVLQSQDAKTAPLNQVLLLYKDSTSLYISQLSAHSRRRFYYVWSVVVCYMLICCLVSHYIIPQQESHECCCRCRFLGWCALHIAAHGGQCKPCISAAGAEACVEWTIHWNKMKLNYICDVRRIWVLIHQNCSFRSHIFGNVRQLKEKEPKYGTDTIIVCSANHSWRMRSTSVLRSWTLDVKDVQRKPSLLVFRHLCKKRSRQSA